MKVKVKFWIEGQPSFWKELGERPRVDEVFDFHDMGGRFRAVQITHTNQSGPYRVKLVKVTEEVQHIEIDSTLNEIGWGIYDTKKEYLYRNRLQYCDAMRYGEWTRDLELTYIWYYKELAEDVLETIREKADRDTEHLAVRKVYKKIGAVVEGEEDE